MKLLNLKSHGSLANLIADSILVLLKSKSVISVTISDSIVVINGVTSTNNFLSITTIKNVVNSCSYDIFGMVKSFEIIETIKYNQNILENYNINNLKVYNNTRPIFKHNIPPVNENKLQYTSEFPHGYSLECGRLVLYYSEMIFKNIKNSIGLQYGNFSIDNKRIRFEGNCILSDEMVESLILDYFNFNFCEFYHILDGYDLKRDVKYPFEIKPWLTDELMVKIEVF